MKTKLMNIEKYNHLNKGVKCPKCYEGELVEVPTRQKSFANCQNCSTRYIVLGDNTVMFDK